MTANTRQRPAEIAAAYKVPFDVDDYSNDWTPAQKLVRSLIDQITSAERQIEERRDWIQSNLDRTMQQVEAPDGRPNGLCAVSSDQLNTLVGQLVGFRTSLADAVQWLFPAAAAKEA